MSQESPLINLPTRLLYAISSKSGQVSLVLGAGCSREEPTGLPLSGALAEECHRRLVEDRVLADDAVGNTQDLSAIADVVFCETGSQEDLVKRFPQEAFRYAEPNEGYLNMAALFLEGAILDTLTLNFDFAARNALAALGAGETVSTVRGPEYHARIGARNLIYLHRDIDSPPDEMILRKEILDEAWQGGWEQVITQRVLSSPVIVFVGLGSPASVLYETMQRIVTAVGGQQVKVYVVDPSPYESSGFASNLGITEEDYYCMGWGVFMRELAQRVTEEQRAAIVLDCNELSKYLGTPSGDVAELCGRLSQIGLVGLGRLRSAWMLNSAYYTPCFKDDSLRLFSSLILGVRMVESLTGREAQFRVDGLVDFCRDDYATSVMICSGGGWRNRSMVEDELDRRYETLRLQGRVPSFALVAGEEHSPDRVTPGNIAFETDPDDLVSGPTALQVLYLSELRSDPSPLRQVIR